MTGGDQENEVRPERAPFADVQNISHNRSRGSLKSHESQTSTPVSRRPRLLLTRDLCDSTDELVVKVNECLVQVKPKRVTTLSSSHTRTLRRTKSDYGVDEPSEPRDSMQSSNWSHCELGDMDIDAYDSVFMEDCSPDVSGHHTSRQFVDVRRSRAASTWSSCFAVNRAGSPVQFEDYKLEGVETPQTPSRAYRSISANVLAQTIAGMGEEFLKTYVVVDCRYPYEYEGGHIKGALNINCASMMENMFFPEDKADPIWKRIPIFYCEYSQKRGPTMAHKMRSIDRQRNELDYPRLDYQEIYLLDRGYNNFWNCGLYKFLCEPSSYVSMFDERHTEALSQFHTHKKRRRERRAPIFSRHHSLLSLGQDGQESMDTSDSAMGIHRAVSTASVGSSFRSVRKRLDFDFD